MKHLIEHHHREEWVIESVSIFNICIRFRLLVTFTILPLRVWENKSRRPLGWTLGRLQIWIIAEERKEIVCVSEILSEIGFSVVQPVASAL